jgi:hypothetical protein
VLKVVVQFLPLHLERMTFIELWFQPKDVLEVSLLVNIAVSRVILVLVGLRLVRKVLSGSLDGHTFAIFVAGGVVRAALLFLTNPLQAGTADGAH